MFFTVYRSTVFLVFLITWLLCGIVNANEHYFKDHISPLKYKVGDELSWRSVDYNDEEWEFYKWGIRFQPNRCWLRGKASIITEKKPLTNIGIALRITATYEVYWNGVFIGNNCLDGNDITAVNGRLVAIFRIPDSVEVLHENLLAIRTAVKEDTPLEVDFIKINDYEHLLQERFHKTLFPIFLLLIYLILALYYWRSFKNHQHQRRNLFYITLLVMLAFHTIWYFAIINLNVIYTHLFIFHKFEDYLALLVFLSIPLFFCYEFDFPYKKLVLLATLVFIVIDFVAILDQPEFQIIGLLPSIAVIIWAFFKRLDGSQLALFGMLCLVAILFSGFVYTLIQTCFLIFLFFISISSSKQMGEQKREYQQSKLRSARLEAELLRKVIQPHYIMNSLNAMIDWLEEEPEKGIEFVNALSEEFHIFSRISPEKLILVEEELKICRAYLKIMAFRQEFTYTLTTEGVDSKKKIPPAIFHTIIENGLTHDPYLSSMIEFIIKEEELKSGIRYRIINRYTPAPKPLIGKKQKIPLPKNAESEHTVEGTGFKYIKARLNESYGSNWRMTSNPLEYGWETVIEIDTNRDL